MCSTRIVLAVSMQGKGMDTVGQATATRLVQDRTLVLVVLSMELAD